MNRKSLALTAALVGISLMVSGCVAAVVVGAAGGAGGYAWASGKLSFTTNHNIDDCHTAAVSALAALGVRITGDTTDQLAGRIKGITATSDARPPPSPGATLTAATGNAAPFSKTGDGNDLLRRQNRKATEIACLVPISI